jgi:hypothetical protein
MVQPETPADRIKQHFRGARKILEPEDEDAEQAAKRRRREETEGAFEWFARIFSRLSTVRQSFKEEQAITRPDDRSAYADAIDYLSNTLDSMNPYCEPDAFLAEIDDECGPPQNYGSPQL